MASKKVKIGIDTTADTSGAKKAAGAMDDLANANTKAATASAAAASGAGRVGQVATAAGYQVQDFATQVSMGTSAFTAFAQQAPQFLGVFGPGGAIAGALLAVGSIAAKVFFDMGDDAKSAAEKAEELAETIEKIGENAGKAIREDIDFGKIKLEQAKTAAKLLAEEVLNAAKNQISYNSSILDSFNNLIAAEKTLRNLKGETTSKVKELEEAEKNAADERAKRTALQIQSEQLKVQAAQSNLDQQKAAVAEAAKQKADGEALLQSERQKIEALRIQLELLKSQSKERVSMAGATGILPGAMISTPTPGPTAAAKAATAQLEGGVLATQLSQLENRIKELEESTASTGKLSETLRIETQKLSEAESQFRQTEADVATSIASITEVAASEDLKTRAKTAEEKAKAFAKEIETMIAGVEPANQKQETALADLGTFLKDGQITQNEIAKTSASLATLSPLIKQSITDNTLSVTQLISIMNSFKNDNQRIQREIDALKKPNARYENIK